MMKPYKRLIPLLAVAAIGLGAFAQVENAGGVRKRTSRDKKERQEAGAPQVTDRMQGFYEAKEPHDADLQYMRQIYRQLDLTKDANSSLFP